jgi:integrase
LIQSSKGKKGKGSFEVDSLNDLVKLWCKEVNISAKNRGSHTLRKTFAYIKRRYELASIEKIS